MKILGGGERRESVFIAGEMLKIIQFEYWFWLPIRWLSAAC